MYRKTAFRLGIVTVTCGVVLSALAQSPEQAQYDGSDAIDETSLKTLPWRNSRFVFDNYLSKNSLFPEQQLTYNPSYVQLYSFRPQYYLSDTLSLRLRQDLIIVLTEPDSYGPYAADSVRDQLFFLNTRVEAFESELYQIGGVRLGAGAMIYLPVSVASRATRQVLGTGAVSKISKTFGDVLEGLQLSAEGLYLHHFRLSNVTAIEGDIKCTPALSGSGAEPSTSLFCLGGASSISDQFWLGFASELMVLTRLPIALGWRWKWRLAASLADAEVETLTGMTTLSDNSKTHWRNLTEFYFTVGYRVDSWVEVSAGLLSISPQLAFNGTRRNPFINDDTQFVLRFTILLDRLYLAL